MALLILPTSENVISLLKKRMKEFLKGAYELKQLTRSMEVKQYSSSTGFFQESMRVENKSGVNVQLAQTKE